MSWLNSRLTLITRHQKFGITHMIIMSWWSLCYKKQKRKRYYLLYYINRYHVWRLAVVDRIDNNWIGNFPQDLIYKYDCQLDNIISYIITEKSKRRRRKRRAKTYLLLHSYITHHHHHNDHKQTFSSSILGWDQEDTNKKNRPVSIMSKPITACWPIRFIFITIIIIILHRDQESTNWCLDQ